MEMERDGPFGTFSFAVVYPREGRYAEIVRSRRCRCVSANTLETLRIANASRAQRNKLSSLLDVEGKDREQVRERTNEKRMLEIRKIASFSTVISTIRGKIVRAL